MTVELTFEIELLSDYHSGAGYGIGTAIDAALLRDGDGIPVLRGTTIAGLLRDGLYRLLKLAPVQAKSPHNCAVRFPNEDNTPHYCGQKDPNRAKDCPLCANFGSPLNSKRWYFSSARPVGLRQAMTSDWKKYHPGSSVAHRARINPRTRRTEERKLFNREMGDSRLRFEFTVTCYEQQDIEEQIEWLVAAARMVRHLGASRRRGSGSCRLTLVNITGPGQLATKSQADYWLDRWRDRLKGQTPASLLPKPVIPQLSLSGDGTPPVRFWLLMRTEEPLLVAERSEAANQFDTRAVIPGPTLRGALASRMADRYPDIRRCNENVYQMFVQLFFHNAVTFPFLYPCQYDPVYEDGVYPMIPAPRDLFSCEINPGFDGHGVRGYATNAQVPDCPICEDRNQQHAQKSQAGKFIPLAPDLELKELERMVEMHITMDPETGRVNQGDLYGYVTLKGGQYFVGELSFANQQAWETFQTLANLPDLGQAFTLHLGRAARRGHGRVTAWLIEPQGENQLWLPHSIENRVNLTQPLTLTLLTDTIIQDTWGQYATSFEEDWLTKELGFAVEIIQQFTRTVYVDSFNNYLGLPRQREIALAAGSTVGLKLVDASPDELSELLKQLEQNAIGLRQNEGFGRVAFNHSIYQEDFDNEQFIDWSDIVGPQLRDPKQHILYREKRFVQDWTITLDFTAWQMEKNERFGSVSRLLHTAHWLDTTLLKHMLDLLGQEQNLLPQPLNGRQKPNYFQEDKQGKAGIKQICTMLDKLESSVTDIAGENLEQQQVLRRRGLVMLADKLAEIADTKGGNL